MGALQALVTIVGLVGILALLLLLVCRYLGGWTWTRAWLTSSREEKMVLTRGTGQYHPNGFMIQSDSTDFNLSGGGSFRRFDKTDHDYQLLRQGSTVSIPSNIPPQPLRPAPSLPSSSGIGPLNSTSNNQYNNSTGSTSHPLATNPLEQQGSVDSVFTVEPLEQMPLPRIPPPPPPINSSSSSFSSTNPSFTNPPSTGPSTTGTAAGRASTFSFSSTPRPTSGTTNNGTANNPNRALPSFSMTNPFLPFLQASTQFFSQTLQGLQSFQNPTNPGGGGVFPTQTETGNGEEGGGGGGGGGIESGFIPGGVTSPFQQQPPEQSREENAFDRARLHSSTSSARSGMSMGELLFSAPPSATVPPPTDVIVHGSTTSPPPTSSSSRIHETSSSRLFSDSGISVMGVGGASSETGNIQLTMNPSNPFSPQSTFDQSLDIMGYRPDSSSDNGKATSTAAPPPSPAPPLHQQSSDSNSAYTTPPESGGGTRNGALMEEAFTWAGTINETTPKPLVEPSRSQVQTITTNNSVTGSINSSMSSKYNNSSMNNSTTSSSNVTISGNNSTTSSNNIATSSNNSTTSSNNSTASSNNSTTSSNNSTASSNKSSTTNHNNRPSFSSPRQLSLQLNNYSGENGKKEEANSIFDQIRDFNELTMSKNREAEGKSNFSKEKVRSRAMSQDGEDSKVVNNSPVIKRRSEPLRPSLGLHFTTTPLVQQMRQDEGGGGGGDQTCNSRTSNSNADSTGDSSASLRKSSMNMNDNRDPLKSINCSNITSSGVGGHYPFASSSYRNARSYSLRQASTDSIGSEASDLNSPDGSLPSLQRAMSCDSVCSDTSVILGDVEQQPQLTGQLCIGLEYDTETADLLVNVIEAKEINGLHPDPTTPFDSYIRVYLLPDKTTNMQTRVYRKSLNPVYKEKFMFGLEMAELPIRSLVFYMYATDKFSNTLIGEAELKLGEVDIHQLPLTTWLPLTDSGQRGGDLGEIMFSLSYLPTAERLTVVVVKARNLKFPRENVGDPFVKVYLLQRGKKVSKKKSSMKKGERNPIFNEAMIFGVPAHALQTIQLRVTVADGSEAEMNRACSIGHVIVGSTTTGKPLSHWNQMLSSLRKPIAMWHSLRK